MSTELKHIPLTMIRQNPQALREVDKGGEKYKGLVESIRELGRILNPINVKPYVDPDSKVECYMLVDGLHRYTGACEAGLSEIPCQIFAEMDDRQAKIAQLIANAHVIETKPVEYSRQLHRILSDDPMYTINKLASVLAKTPTWLGERLGLVKLKSELGKLVDEGKINLSNAYALAKLPEEYQDDFKERAITMEPGQFLPAVTARKKEIDLAKRQGREASSEQFVHKPHVRKIVDLLEEIEKPTVGPSLCAKADLGKSVSKIAAAEAGFKLGLQYALNTDPTTVELAKAAWIEKNITLKAKKDAATVERSQKRAVDAAVKAERFKIEADVRASGGDLKEALKAFDDDHGLVDGKKSETVAS